MPEGLCKSPPHTQTLGVLVLATKAVFTNPDVILPLLLQQLSPSSIDEDAEKPHIQRYCVMYSCIYIYTVSKKTGPLVHFQITPTILLQYQQNLVQRIVN